jgi:predicted nucleic acid-binding protein
MKRVYLDVCALCRPFDDQSQIRIRMETDAVQLILAHIREGKIQLIISPVHHMEISATANTEERIQLETLLEHLATSVDFDLTQGRARAEKLANQGLGPADAARIAFAEQAGADFVTCDDRLLRRGQRSGLRVWSGTPIQYCEKEELT